MIEGLEEIINVDFAEFKCMNCNSYFLLPVTATLATIRQVQADHVCRNSAFVAQKKEGVK